MAAHVLENFRDQGQALHPRLARTRASQGGPLQIGAAKFKVTLSQLSFDVG